MKYRIYTVVLSVVLALALLVLGHYVPREQIDVYLGLYALAFIAYGLLVSLAIYRHKWQGLVLLGIGIRVALIFAPTHSSDDHYRYVWDGQQTIAGIDPYAFTPDSLIAEGKGDTALYAKLNSQGFYTVYPPVSQLVFAASAWVAQGDVDRATAMLKLFQLIFELMIFWVLIRLLAYNGRPRSEVLLYVLNPLIIIELLGNIHLETAMIAFSLLALYWWQKERSARAGVYLGLAFCVKLWPLLFIPYFIRQRPQWRSVAWFLGWFGITVGWAFWLFWHPDLMGNIQSSIGLYFRYFEFNASIFYLFRWVVVGITDYGTYENLVKYLPIAMLASQALLFLFLKPKTRSYLPKVMLYSLGIYLAFATTVHPWYITPLVAFGILVGVHWSLVWSALIPLTYIAYSASSPAEWFGVVIFIYLVVYAYLLFELVTGNSSFRKKQLLSKATVKLKRILPLMEPDRKLLDIGTGTGGLALLLLAEGKQVTSVDVVDKSDFEEVIPKLYNGHDLPFDDASFEVVQLITVLHHIPDPDRLLQETLRVGKKVIVMEDVYSNPLQKYITWFADSLVNKEFWGHPHTNRTDAEWKATFNKLRAELVFEEQYRFLGLFRQVTYVLINRKHD